MTSLQVITGVQMRGLIELYKRKRPILSQSHKRLRNPYLAVPIWSGA